MPGDQPFYSRLVDEYGKTETLLGELFDFDKKEKKSLSIDLLKDKVGTKTDMASWMMKMVKRLQTNLTLLKQSIDEVEVLRKESYEDQKKCVDLQNKLINSDRFNERQVTIFSKVVEEKLESTLVGEIKQYCIAMF